MTVCRREILFDAESDELRSVYRKYLDTYTVEKIFPGATDISPETFRENVLGVLAWNFIGEPNTVLLRKKRLPPLRSVPSPPDPIVRLRILDPRRDPYRIHICAGNAGLLSRSSRCLERGPPDDPEEKEGPDRQDPVLERVDLQPDLCPLRHAASRRRPPLDFMEPLIRRMREIRAITAEKVPGRIRRGKSRTDWEFLLSTYPTLGCVPANRLSGYLRKMRSSNGRSRGDSA